MIGNKSIKEIIDNQSPMKDFNNQSVEKLEHLATVFYNETGYSVVNHRLKFFEWVDKNYIIIKKK